MELNIFSKISKTDHPADPLLDDINTHSTFSLEQMPMRVLDLSDEIQMILNREKNPEPKIRHLIVSEIIRASQGYLTVPQYDQSAKSKQEVYGYCGTHWKKLDRQKYYDLIRDCCTAIGVDEEYISDPAYMNKIYENVAHGVAHAREQVIPSNQVWINFQNGTLKIQANGTSVLDKHNQDDFFCYVIPYEHGKEAKCPLWETTLSEILPDEDTRLLLQEHIGLLLYKGEARVEKMAILYGSGANGKSVVLNTIEAMLGKTNTSNIPLDTLTNDKNARSQIEHKLCNFSSESGPKIDTAILKDMISKDPITVKYLYKDIKTMHDYARTIASFNILPKPEQTRGYYRRMDLIPFNNTFEGKKANKELPKMLIKELPGILNWALDGLLRLIDNGFNFTESEVCEKALEEYRLSDDSVAAYLDEYCEINPIFKTSGADLFYAYKSYCNEYGFTSVGKKVFYTRLQKDFKAHRTDPGHMPCFGIRIK